MPVDTAVTTLERLAAIVDNHGIVGVLIIVDAVVVVGCVGSCAVMWKLLKRAHDDEESANKARDRIMGEYHSLLKAVLDLKMRWRAEKDGEPPESG